METKFVAVFWLLCCFLCKGHINGLTVTLSDNAIDGQTVNLLITPASGSITSSVVVNKPDSSEAGNCGAPLQESSGMCTPSADFSQDFATGLTTFSISPLSRATDEGLWTGSHGTEVQTIDIKVLTLPSAISAPSPVVPAFTLSNGVNSFQDFVVTIPCAYSTASLNWFFVPVNGGASVSAESSSTWSCTSTGNAGCSDTDANSYSCTVRPQHNVDVAGQKVYMFAALTLAGEYQSTGITLTITDTEITMEEMQLSISLTKDSCGFVGSTITLNCTTNSFTQAIAWTNAFIPGDITSCLPSGCPSHQYSNYVTRSNLKGTYLAITALARSRDETTWKCTITTLTPKSSSLSIIVRDYPTNCTLEQSGKDYICKTDCGYPETDLKIKWFLNTTSTSALALPDQPVITTTTGCSIGGTAQATLSASNVRSAGDLYCECGMQTACPEKPTLVSNSMAVTAKERPSAGSSLSVGGIVGIVVAAIAILFLVAVGVFVVWRNRGTKEKYVDDPSEYLNPDPHSHRDVHHIQNLPPYEKGGESTPVAV